MKVVFDTNIVISASFWKGKPLECLLAWNAGQVTAFVSPQILAEYVEIALCAQERYPKWKRREWVEMLTRSAELVFPVERVREGKDPDDEMFLEGAVAAGADCLVSGDKKHLLTLGEVRGVEIISAVALLTRL